MASFHLTREARAAATSPSDLLRQARAECEAVLGPWLHLQSVPLTCEIRVFFCHQDGWHLAMPIDPSTWIVDQVLALQTACCQPVMTDRAQALIRQLGYGDDYLLQAARVAVGREPAGSEVNIEVPVEVATFVARRGEAGEIEVDLDMQHVGGAR